MNAIITQPQQEFTHQNTPLFFEADKVLSHLMDFAADCANEDESECDAWGYNDLVFPASAYSEAVALLTSNPTLLASRKSGDLHFELLEVEDGDEVDAVILKGGYLEIQQGIYFYNL